MLLIGIVADLVGVNRTILEETLYRVRKIDMMLPSTLGRGTEAERLSDIRGRKTALSTGPRGDESIVPVNGAVAGSEYFHEV